MNISQRCNVLLTHIEYVLEENKFSEYTFGVSYPEMLVTFDNDIINIIAYKKLLHYLETTKNQISGSKELQDEHFRRIEILKLKIENKLNMELLGNEKRLQIINKNLCSHLKSENAVNGSFENEFANFASKNYLEEYAQAPKSKIEENSDCDTLDLNSKNNQFKDELVELAEEMKHSAFRFKELLVKEKKVSFLIIYQTK